MDVMKKRILATVLGVCANGVCVGFFKFAAFGVDPFQCAMSGFDAAIPISFGTLYVIVNVILLAFSLIFDRHYIGLGTFINLFLLGYIAEYSQNFLTGILPNTIPVRAICLIIGILAICVSSAFYMTADLGVSTYDAVALIMANKWHLAPFKFIRIITDLCCIAIGCALILISGNGMSGILANVNVGTIITAFCMGPLIAYLNVKVAIPIIGMNPKK